jgi:hypothetical protein
MAIEHREINPPRRFVAGTSVHRLANHLESTTPRGRVLSAGLYTYSSPVDHEITALRVLRTGRALLRVVGETDDFITAIKNKTPDHLYEEGDAAVVYDSDPEDPNMISVNHLFLYRPGRSPVHSPSNPTRPGGNRLRWGGTPA